MKIILLTFRHVEFVIFVSSWGNDEENNKISHIMVLSRVQALVIARDRFTSKSSLKPNIFYTHLLFFF